jgi:hypothetical protein
MRRLIRKLVILAAILAIPAALSSTGSRHVQAAVCCSVCVSNYNTCLEDCVPIACHLCDTNYRICETTCTKGC